MKRSPAQQLAWESQLTELVLGQFFQDVGPEFAKKYRRRLLTQLRKLYAEQDDWGQGVLDLVGRGNGKKVSDLLRSHWGVAGLKAWAKANAADLAQVLSAAELHEVISSWLIRNPGNLSKGVLEAAIRHNVAKSGADHARIQSTLGTYLQGIKEVQMATTVVSSPPTYHVDVNAVPLSAIPQGSTPQTYDNDYTTNVSKLIKGQVNVPLAGNEHVYGAIIGSLLLDEYYDWTAQGFNDNISKSWVQTQKTVTDSSGQPIVFQTTVTDANGNPIIVGGPGPNDQLTGAWLYAYIQAAILEIRKGASPPNVFYQEFAQAGRQIVQSGKGSLLNETSFEYFVTAVRLALDSYVSGAPGAGSLELPPLSDPSGGDSEIVAENVRAVSMIYAAYELEQVKLIPVIERTVEVWSNGQLAINFGPAGKALDRWYWDSFERMTDAGRMMQFTRVLGAKGGEVSKEVLPNNNFNDLLLRFLSSLSEYDRQTRIADIVGSTRAGNVSDAQVRKAGRDLAANMSLYGWGGTQFAARRLNTDIATAVAILQKPEIQNAWGVQSAWQVVERVCTQEFNFTPNVVKYRTMAESGKTILDLVAKYYNVWGSTTNNPLFCVSFDAYGNPKPGTFDISPDDQRTLMRHTEYWLAVNGIKDKQVVDNAEPSDTAYSPSIPTLEPTSTNGSGGAIAEQLKQMVQQGQTPTLEQIQKMLPVAKVGG